MQNGRHNRLDGRLPIPINRGSTGYATKIFAKNGELERRKPAENRRREEEEEEVGKLVGASFVNLPEEGKVGGTSKKVGNGSNIPTKQRGKVARNEVSRGSQSIRKLLSEFESGERNSNFAKPKMGEDRKPKPIVKTVRLDRPAVEKPTGRRVKSVLAEREKAPERNSEIEFPGRKFQQRKKSSLEESSSGVGKSPAVNLAESMVVSSVAQDKKNSVSSEATSSDDQLIPIMTPEGRVKKSVNLINSIITGYLDEKPEERPLDFLLPGGGGGTGGSGFPVCSKKATDNIPSSEATSIIQEGRMPDKSDLIIMLRRRNSEPYPPKKYLLQPTADSENPTWKLNPVENYYLWKSGPTQPYWEVSLFKSNRSLSVLTSRAASGMLSLTPAGNSAEILQSGRFIPRKLVAESKPSWLGEISSFAEDRVQTMPFITLMEKRRIIPMEPQVEPARKRPVSPNRPRRIMSKDDHYNPPGHLLVYVKSSQRKLVTVQGNNCQQQNTANTKIHRISKMRGINSESGSSVSTTSSWHKKIVATATTAFAIVIAAFLFLLYHFTTSNSYSNLTPPIPGLVRGC